MAMPKKIRPIRRIYLLMPIEQISPPITKIKLDTIIIVRLPYLSEKVPAKSALKPAVPK